MLACHPITPRVCVAHATSASITRIEGAMAKSTRITPLKTKKVITRQKRLINQKLQIRRERNKTPELCLISLRILKKVVSFKKKIKMNCPLKSYKRNYIAISLDFKWLEDIKNLY